MFRFIAKIIPLLLLAACVPARATPTVEATITRPPAAVRIVTASPTPTLLPTHAAVTLAPKPPVPTLSNDPAYYYGGILITLDSVGQTVLMKRTNTFVLSLGDNYDWEIAIDPPDIATRNMKVTPGPGEQGVFIARKAGQATIRAVGSPKCMKSDPPCAQPSILFQVEISVE